MRIIRYQRGLEAFDGVLDGDTVHALERDRHGAPRRGPALCGLSDVTLLCPCAPRQVISVGANYADRCRENDLAIPPSPGRDDTFVMPGEGVVVGPGALIRLPPWEQHVEYGAELGIVIGRGGSRISPAHALDHVLGFVSLNNLWAKTRPRVPGAMNIRVYDSFCPIGPWVETELSTRDLRLTLRVNGELRQDTRTSSMLFDVPTILAHVSELAALAPGDVIMTGTPSGVRRVAHDDRIEVEIEGIGVLRNRVVADPSVARRPLRRITDAD
jgi:2-keto-4-pentenoate hydratase/2-oxohepta-3-ene-1,7-dioic acid hydratase in catechol pathway